MHLGRFELHLQHGVKYPVWLSRKGKAVKSHSKSKRTIEKDGEAQARRNARNSRSDRQQLQLLVERGAGHCKEADKLRHLIGGKLLAEDDADAQARLADEAVDKAKRKRPARKRRAVPASLM